VSYSVQPPLVTPELYELGPAQVDYGTSTFTEARPWYLAVDPSPELLFIQSGKWEPPDGASLSTADLTDLNTSGGAGVLLDANGAYNFTGVLQNPTPYGQIDTVTQVHIIMDWIDAGVERLRDTGMYLGNAYRITDLDVFCEAGLQGFLGTSIGSRKRYPGNQ